MLRIYKLLNVRNRAYVVDSKGNKLFYGTDICAPKEYEFFKLVDFLESGLTKNKLSKTAYDKICRLNAESFLLSQS